MLFGCDSMDAFGWGILRGNNGSVIADGGFFSSSIWMKQSLISIGISDIFMRIKISTISILFCCFRCGIWQRMKRLCEIRIRIFSQHIIDSASFTMLEYFYHHQKYAHIETTKLRRRGNARRDVQHG
jgi:hypothetical protein